jgi:2-dehydropantoate 2-reductase
MNIYIYGTGAVGSFIGSLIAETNPNTLFLSRGNTFKDIKQNGLSLKTNKCTHSTIYPKIFDTQIINNISDLPFYPDLVIYCVKSYHNEESINYLKHLFDRKIPYILSLQNGFKSTEDLNEIFGKNILTGAAYVDAILHINGKINETGGDPKIIIGSMYDPKIDLLNDFHKTIHSEELSVIVDKDIKSVIWRKLMYISSLSGIMCLYRQPLENILSDKISQNILWNLISETYNTAIKDNANISESEIKKVYDELYNNQPNSISSMYEDMKKSNSIEVDAIQCYVSNIAKSKNLKVPYTDLVSSVLTKYRNFRM